MCPVSHSDLFSSDVPEATRFADVVHAAGVYRLVYARCLHEDSGGVETIEHPSKGPCFPYSNCAGRCLNFDGLQF